MKSNVYIVQYDRYILILYMLLMVIGLYMQLNISSIRTNMSFFYRQFIWFGLSIFSLWFAFKVVNLQKVRKFSLLFIIFTIILLISVLIFGESVKGAVRSIKIWNIGIQPSLIARIVLIIYFAHILDKRQNLIGNSNPKEFIKNFNALIVIPLILFLLILIEKHFSLLIISGLTLISLLFLARIKFSTIFLIIGMLFIMGILVIELGPSYRSERMKIYSKYSLFNKIKNEETKYNGTGNYQVKESLISLSSGKLVGVTPKKGTGKHYFLPEAKTDYIFSIIGEEFGFIGSLFILTIYSYLFARSMISSNTKESLFLKLAGFGLGMNIFFNAMVNIGVSIAALPSTGVTLPFISYGGTSLVVNSFSIGLLLNISAKRQKI